MVAERTKTERLASILAALPNVFLASELPRPTPGIAPGCVAAGRVDTLQPAPTRPTAGLCGGVKLNKVGLRKGAKRCENEKTIRVLDIFSIRL